jgi:hypothetical protein
MMRCASSVAEVGMEFPHDGQAVERLCACTGVSGSGLREITGDGGCDRG